MSDSLKREHKEGYGQGQGTYSPYGDPPPAGSVYGQPSTGAYNPYANGGQQPANVSSYPTSGQHHAYETDDDLIQGAIWQASIEVRHGFIRKVYSLLSLMLLMTVGMSSLMMYHTETRLYFEDHSGWYIFAMVSTFIMLCVLFCVRKTHPYNLIVLFLWNGLFSLMIGMICARYYAEGKGDIVLEAFAITTVISIALTLYTFQTKRDFTSWGTGLFAATLCLIIWGFFMMIFGAGRIGELIYALIGAILFCLWLVYDTQRIVKYCHADEYVMATVDLFLDLINIFLFILRILDNSR